MKQVPYDHSNPLTTPIGGEKIHHFFEKSREKTAKGREKIISLLSEDGRLSAAA